MPKVIIKPSSNRLAFLQQQRAFLELERESWAALMERKIATCDAEIKELENKYIALLREAGCTCPEPRLSESPEGPRCRVCNTQGEF